MRPGGTQQFLLFLAKTLDTGQLVLSTASFYSTNSHESSQLSASEFASCTFVANTDSKTFRAQSTCKLGPWLIEACFFKVEPLFNKKISPEATQQTLQNTASYLTRFIAIGVKVHVQHSHQSKFTDSLQEYPNYQVFPVIF